MKKWENLLSIFIPTYNRPTAISNLLHSIIEDNSKYLGNISIYISSNSPQDSDTLEIVYKWKEKYPYISYFVNERNIGIDANHDKVYKYCQNSKYALTLGDDDLLLPDALREIISLCKNDFLFASCNAVRYKKSAYGGHIERTKMYCNDDTLYLKAKDMLRALLYQIRPMDVLPLLPPYGGNIINIEYMNEHTTSSGREIFEGTYHQYIGCLWNELLQNENLYAVITGMPLFAFGYDVEEKTWLNEKQNIIDLKIPNFYKRLCLGDEIKEEVLEYYSSLYAHS